MSVINTILNEASVSGDTIDKYLSIEDKLKSGFGFYKPTKKNIRSRWVGAAAYRLGMPRPQNRQAAKGWDWARQDKDRAYEQYLFKAPKKRHIAKDPDMGVKTESWFKKHGEKPDKKATRKFSFLYPYNVPAVMIASGLAGGAIGGGVSALYGVDGSTIAKNAVRSGGLSAAAGGLKALAYNVAADYSNRRAKKLGLTEKTNKKKPGAKP